MNANIQKILRLLGIVVGGIVIQLLVTVGLTLLANFLQASTLVIVGLVIIWCVSLIALVATGIQAGESLDL